MLFFRPAGVLVFLYTFASPSSTANSPLLTFAAKTSESVHGKLVNGFSWKTSESLHGKLVNGFSCEFWKCEVGIQVDFW